MYCNCCSLPLRIIVFILNFILLLLGIVVVVITLLPKWANFFPGLPSIKGLDQFMNFASINSIALVLLCIGGFCILLSVLGLFGVICSNKCFLSFYMITVVILFIAHFAAFLVIYFRKETIENQFGKSFNDTLAKASVAKAPYETDEIKLLKYISDEFKCCSINGRSDFASLNYELLNATCPNMAYHENGCYKAIITELENNALRYFIIPNVAILVVELSQIIMVPILISSMRKSYLSIKM